MWPKSKLWQIIYLNFIFIFILGLIRFNYFSPKSDESYRLFSITNLVLTILSSIIMGFFAKNYFPNKDKKNLLRFMALFYFYAFIGLDLLRFTELFPLLFWFFIGSSQGIDTLIFSLLIKLVFSVPIIFLPAYLAYKSNLTIKNLESKIKISFPYVVIIIILMIIFLFDAFVFGINPTCAVISPYLYTSEEFQDFCYVPLAFFTRDSKYCSDDLYYSDKCVMVVAKVKNDPSECLHTIYMDGLLRLDETTCITQFFHEKDGYKMCHTFENYSHDLVDRCIELFVGWQVDYDSVADHDNHYNLEHYGYLKDICDSISHGDNSYCSTAMVDYENLAKLPRNKKPTLDLIRKYRDTLKDEQTFFNAVFNPPDIDFCRLLRIFSDEHTIADNSFFWFDEDDYHSMVCFVNFGKKGIGTDICDLPKGYEGYMANSDKDDSWIVLCGAGRYFVDRNNPKWDDMYDRYYIFQPGIGIASYNKETQIPEDWQNNKYVNEGIDIVTNLKRVNFCDRVKQFQKECREIVYG